MLQRSLQPKAGKDITAWELQQGLKTQEQRKICPGEPEVGELEVMGSAFPSYSTAVKNTGLNRGAGSAHGSRAQHRSPLTVYKQRKVVAHQDIDGRRLHGDVDGVQLCLLDVLHTLDVDVEDADLVLGLNSLHCAFTGG